MSDDMRLGASLAAIVAGDGTAVIGPTLVALVDALPSDSVVEQIWSVAEREGTFDDVLSALGVLGFGDLPSLAVFSWEGTGCRVVIRGGIGLEVSGLDGLQVGELLGGSVRSWAEHVFDEVGSLRAWIGPTRVATPEFLGYAIDRGIAPARGVDVLAPGTAVARPPKRAASTKRRPTSAEVRKRALDASANLAELIEAPRADEDAAEPAAVGPGEAAVIDAEPVGDGAVEPDDLAAVDVPAVDVPAVDVPAVDVPAVDVPAVDVDAVAPASPNGGGGTLSLDTILPQDLVGAKPNVAEPPAPTPPAQAAEQGSGAFDHLWGATEYRSVEAAAIRSSEADDASDEGGPPAPMPITDDPDHDGLTVTAAQLRKMVGSPNELPAPAGGAAGGHLAVRCARNHLNPPHASVCRACGQAVGGGPPVRVATIDLGSLRFKDGTRVPVRKPMLIGRSPKMSGSISGAIPELVQVDSPAQDISRTHLEIRVEGWQVLVVDRDSTNGTILSLPGRDPQRLRPHHPVPLPIGATVDLAGEAEFVFEVGP